MVAINKKRQTKIRRKDRGKIVKEKTIFYHGNCWYYI